MILDKAKGRHCACGNIRRTSRAVTQFFDSTLKPSKLRVTQFSLLFNISLYENISVTELSELLIMDQTTVTRNLKILKKSGYIFVTKGSDDGRKKMVSLTEKGREKLEEVVSLWELAQCRIVEGLGAERFHDFLVTLSKIADLTR